MIIEMREDRSYSVRNYVYLLFRIKINIMALNIGDKVPEIL